jgi:hypothetical protein
VRQGAIVENKRLAAVLSKIRDDQRERDKETIREAQDRAEQA